MCTATKHRSLSSSVTKVNRPRMTIMFTRFVFGLGCVAACMSAAIGQDKVDFEKQIQPIFADHCVKCHGEKQASGKMRLHTAAGLKEKWDADKELVIAGEPDKSELYQRLVLPA